MAFDEVTDWAVDWFIRNILVRGQEKIASPGFIIASVSGNNKQISLREIMIPETIINNLEIEIVKIEGQNGKQNLYSAGKQFSYFNGSISNFPSLKTKKDQKEISDFLYFFLHYVGGIYANKISSENDIEKKTIIVHAKDFLVCSKNGLGYLISCGGIAGYVAFSLNEKTIEATQIKCQGRGDNECHILAGPSALFPAQFEFNEINLEQIKWDETKYSLLNQVRPATFCTHSLSQLIQNHVFSFAHGKLTFKNERFFFIEASFLHFLENNLSSKGKEILFETCYSFGKEISNKMNEKSLTFLRDLLSCSGFGDILVSTEKDKIKVMVNYYPWIEDNAHEYIYFRGLASGLLSGILNREIRLQHWEGSTLQNYFGISFW